MNLTKSLPKRLPLGGVLLFFFLLLTTSSWAQHGIGTTQPNSDAALHIAGDNKGVLFPQVSLTASATFLGGATATASHTGMLVYNTNTATNTGLVGEGYYFWNGSQWEKFLGDTDSQTLALDASATTTQTTLTISEGNAITLTATNSLRFNQTATDTLEIGFISGTATGTTLIWDPEIEQWKENPNVHYRDPGETGEFLALDVVTDGDEGADLKNPQDVKLAGNIAYVVTYLSNQLHAYDISNPTKITLLGSLSITRPWTLAIKGNYAYVTTTGGIEIVDISDPANMISAGSFIYTGVTENTTSYLVLSEDQNTLYQTIGVRDRLNVIDVTNSTSPTLLGSITDTTNLGHLYDIEVRGNYVYVPAISADRFTIIDVSTPALPTIAASFLHDATAGILLDGASDVSINGDYAYVTSIPNTLAIFDISTPTSPTHLVSIDDNNTFASDTSFNNSYENGRVYITNSSPIDGGVLVFDVSNPTNPSVLRSFTALSAEQLIVRNGIVYTVHSRTDRFSAYRVAGDEFTIESNFVLIDGTQGAGKVLTSDSIGRASWQTTRGLIDVDSDTQIQVEESIDDDTIRFDTRGAERMVIEPEGNVGIGTNDATETLDVNGRARIRGLNSGGDANRITVSSSDGTLFHRSAAEILAAAGGSLATQDQTLTATRAVTTNNFDLNIDANTLFVDGSANRVGIGTNAPSQALDVNGRARIRTLDSGGDVNRITVSDASGTLFRRTAAEIVATAGVSDTSLATDNQSLTAERTIFNNDHTLNLAGTGDLNIDSGTLFVHGTLNHVGIGTQGPLSELDVFGEVSIRQIQDTGGDLNRILVTDANGRIRRATAAEVVTFGGGTPSTDTSLSTHNQNLTGNRAVTTSNFDLNIDSNTLVIDGSENRVGIGTNAPSRALDVAGEARIRTLNSGGDANRILVSDTNGNLFRRTAAEIVAQGGTLATQDQILTGTRAVTTNDFDLNIDANTLFVDGSANRVGIGTNAPTQALDVDGEVRLRNLPIASSSTVPLVADLDGNLRTKTDWRDIAIQVVGANQEITTTGTTESYFVVGNEHDGKSIRQIAYHIFDPNGSYTANDIVLNIFITRISTGTSTSLLSGFGSAIDPGHNLITAGDPITFIQQSNGTHNSSGANVAGIITATLAKGDIIAVDIINASGGHKGLSITLSTR